jgi:hypothetical protein
MSGAARPVRDPSRLTNPEVATYALWRVGGAKKPCETEDVAALCWKIAPSRFSWKRYPQFPDKETIRFALADAKKKKYGELVHGSGGEGWILTTNGIRWVERNMEVLRKLDGAPGRSRLDPAADEQLRHAREHYLFQRWHADQVEPPEYYDVADLAELPADAPQTAVADRLSRLENVTEIAGDHEMKEFLIWVRTGTTR